VTQQEASVEKRQQAKLFHTYALHAKIHLSLSSLFILASPKAWYCLTTSTHLWLSRGDDFCPLLVL
jgi:hypothetical protein